MKDLVGGSPSRIPAANLDLTRELLREVTVVVPARNEEEHLPVLLKSLAHEIPECRVVVVDNGSADATSDVARALGAEVVVESTPGKGAAVKAGLRTLDTPLAFLCDADIRGLTRPAIAGLVEALERTGAPAVRMAIDRPPERAPVTLLTARPILAALGINGAREPLGGLLLAKTSWLRAASAPDDWAFDVALTVAAARAGTPVVELTIAGITHRAKPLADYSEMAHQIARYLVQEV